MHQGAARNGHEASKEREHDVARFVEGEYERADERVVEGEFGEQSGRHARVCLDQQHTPDSHDGKANALAAKLEHVDALLDVEPTLRLHETREASRD